MKSALLFGLAGLAATTCAHSERRSTTRGVDISKYGIMSQHGVGAYSTSDQVQEDGVIASLGKRSTYVETATELVKTTVPGIEFRLAGDHYVDVNGIAHVNFKQTTHGIDIDNADFNVNIGKDGHVFSFGNSFFMGKLPPVNPLLKRAFSEPLDALKVAVNTLGLSIDIPGNSKTEPLEAHETYTFGGTSGAVSNPKARLVYVARSDATLALSWRVETDVRENWLLSYVDATNGKNIHGVVDYVQDAASYKVYPWGLGDPTEGERKLVTDPWDKDASEFTWHDDQGATSKTTRGNNGVAQVEPRGSGRPRPDAWKTGYRPTSTDGKFDYAYNPGMTTPEEYRDASITQLWYTANMCHDVFYTLGFTEAAGNFELNNNNQGGKGNDMVIINVQGNWMANNAFFSTPPDGESGRLEAFMFTEKGKTSLDSVFDAGVIIHEYTHGLSSRLTGGPANSLCLPDGEAAGLGEGWGDFMAVSVLLKPSDTRNTDHVLGAWVTRTPLGIRDYAYSTNLKTNPLIYSAVKSGQSHFTGTVWASMLYEMLWNLIDKHGKSHDDFPEFDGNGVPTDGKFLAMKLVVAGMALQPCRPTFIDARNAIIDADKNLTGGGNKCEIWKAFSKRGLGPLAKYNATKRVDDFSLPAGC